MRERQRARETEGRESTLEGAIPSVAITESNDNNRSQSEHVMPQIPGYGLFFQLCASEEKCPLVCFISFLVTFSLFVSV